MTPIPFDSELGQAVSKLQQAALYLNNSDFNVWCDFAGHVQSVGIRAMAGGYEKNKDNTFERSVYLDRKGSLELVRAITKDLLWHYHEHQSAKIGVST